MAKRKNPVLTRTQARPTPATASRAASADTPKTFSETKLLIAVVFGIVGIAVARLFLFDQLEAAKFEYFLRGQAAFDLGALLQSAAFWKAIFGFIIGGNGGYFLVRDLPVQPRADVISRRIAVFLAVLIVYIPAMSSGFIWDDDQLVTANPSMQ